MSRLWIHVKRRCFSEKAIVYTRHFFSQAHLAPSTTLAMVPKCPSHQLDKVQHQSLGATSLNFPGGIGSEGLQKFFQCQGLISRSSWLSSVGASDGLSFTPSCPKQHKCRTMSVKQPLESENTGNLGNTEDRIAYFTG